MIFFKISNLGIPPIFVEFENSDFELIIINVQSEKKKHFYFSKKNAHISKSKSRLKQFFLPLDVKISSWKHVWFFKDEPQFGSFVKVKLLFRSQVFHVINFYLIFLKYTPIFPHLTRFFYNQMIKIEFIYYFNMSLPLENHCNYRKAQFDMEIWRKMKIITMNIMI